MAWHKQSTTWRRNDGVQVRKTHNGCQATRPLPDHTGRRILDFEGIPALDVLDLVNQEWPLPFKYLKHDFSDLRQDADSPDGSATKVCVYCGEDKSEDNQRVKCPARR